MFVEIPIQQPLGLSKAGECRSETGSGAGNGTRPWKWHNSRTLDRTNSPPSRGLCQRRNRSLTFFLCIFNLQFFAVCKFCRIANDRKRAPGAEVQEFEGCLKGQTHDSATVLGIGTELAKPHKGKRMCPLRIATERRTSGSTSRTSR